MATRITKFTRLLCSNGDISAIRVFSFPSSGYRSYSSAVASLETEPDSGLHDYVNYRKSIHGGITHKALLVDAVGTLVIPSQPMAQIYRKIGEKYGVKFSEDEILRRYRRAYEQPWGRSRIRFIVIFRRPDSSVSRRRDSDFFSDMFDPISPTRSLSQIFNMMDRFMENPFMAASPGGGLGLGGRRGWDAKENDESLSLRFDMPGLDKENVKISVEQNTLIIKAEAEKESEEDEEPPRRYSSRIDLPMDAYKLDEIKAEMKNGVLKIMVPKVKTEERKNVLEVEVK